MRRHTRRIQRVVFGMGMMAAMGFGAAQAAAAPAQAKEAAACTREQERYCINYCIIESNGNGWSCNDGQCICW